MEPLSKGEAHLLFLILVWHFMQKSKSDKQWVREKVALLLLFFGFFLFCFVFVCFLIEVRVGLVTGITKEYSKILLTPDIYVNPLNIVI
jgi:predicted membrane protein